MPNLSYLWNINSNFTDKVVLIAGGSSGIGFQSALSFARNGAKVVFCARDSNPQQFNGSFAESQINNDTQVKAAGGNATFYKANITNISEIRLFINFTHNLYKKIDMAINSAGIIGYLGLIKDLKPEWLRSEHDPIQNNLQGTLFLMREEALYWQKNGNPNSVYSIVNLGSTRGKKGGSKMAMQSASKQGIIGLTKSIAGEQINTKPKIRVNAVAPSFVNTPFLRNQIKFFKNNMQPWEGDIILDDNVDWQNWKASIEKRLSGGKIGKSEEIVNTIMAICDEKSSYMTGSVITVDDAASSSLYFPYE